MLHFTQYFQKHDISKAPNGVIMESRAINLYLRMNDMVVVYERQSIADRQMLLLLLLLLLLTTVHRCGNMVLS